MDKKKLAAAMAAVFAYIKTSEEAMSCNVTETSESVSNSSLALLKGMQQNNIWGISGRQNHMQANSMMQMRMFK